MLLKLMPESWRPYAKTVVAVAASILAVIPQVIPALPEEWQAAVSGFVLVVSPYVVWLVRNVEPEPEATDV